MTTLTTILLAISIGLVLGTAVPMSCARHDHESVAYLTLFIGLGVFLLTLVFALGRTYAV